MFFKGDILLVNVVSFNTNIRISFENAEKLRVSYNQGRDKFYDTAGELFNSVDVGFTVDDTCYILFCYFGAWSEYTEQFYYNIAPYAEDGSSICLKDTQGQIWRYSYCRGELSREEATKILLWGDTEGKYLYLKDEDTIQKVRDLLQEENIQYTEADTFKNTFGLFGIDCTFM